MAIFGNLELEDIVQTSDKTRLNATKTFIDKSEADITLVEIEPEAGDGFVDVTGNSSKDWFLDWEYAGISRTVTVSVRVTTDGAPVTSTKTIEVITPADDKLFSTDTDLTAIEPDVLKYVRLGRNTFLDVHRKAQELLLDSLNDAGIRNDDGSRVTKDQILDFKEVKKWSENLALRLIYEGLSNSVGDIFNVKAEMYAAKEAEARKRASLRFDADKNLALGLTEGVDLTTRDLVRR